MRTLQKGSEEAGRNQNYQQCYCLLKVTFHKMLMKIDIHGQHCKTWVYLVLFLHKSSFFSTCLICRYSFGCFLIFFLNVSANKSLSIILFNKFCFIHNVRATKANLNGCAQPAFPQFLKTNECFSTLGLLFWFL